MKSRKAYIARVSPDGQVMVLAMNQKLAAHNRVMFYSLSQTAVAVIADLKGCGAKLNMNGHPAFGKLVLGLINNQSSYHNHNRDSGLDMFTILFYFSVYSLVFVLIKKIISNT